MINWVKEIPSWRQTHKESSRGITRLFLKRQYLGQDVSSEQFWHVVILNSGERRETRRCITAINLGSVVSAHRRRLLDRLRKRISGHPYSNCQSYSAVAVCLSRVQAALKQHREKKIHKTPLIEVLLSGSVVIPHVTNNAELQKSCYRTQKQTVSL